MKFFFKVIISAFAVFISAHFLGGVTVEPFTTAIVVAFVLAILNILLKPVLIVLTIPVTLMSLGLFLLVINAFMVLIAAELVKGFEVAGFWWALLFSIILTLVNWLLEMPIGSGRRGRQQGVSRNGEWH
jgi:putative membrane protein